MKVSASIVPDSCRLFFVGRRLFFCVRRGFPFATQRILRKRVCRCTEPQKERRFLSATQGILRKRVCRCIVLLLFLYPAVAIQVFPLEMVCRCAESWQNGSFPFATQGILRKRVCRCTEPLHRPSARTLCTNSLHEPSAQNRGTG